MTDNNLKNLMQQFRKNNQNQMKSFGKGKVANSSFKVRKII